MKKQETIEEMEKRDAAGYARIPSQASEFEEWEPEQVWDEDEEGDPEEAIQQTAATSERARVMAEALEQAAEIRHQLEGRHHSDSTELVAEDRNRATEEAQSDQEFTLKDLLTGVTKKNRHPEVDFGHPVGKEKL